MSENPLPPPSLVERGYEIVELYHQTTKSALWLVRDAGGRQLLAKTVIGGYERALSWLVSREITILNLLRRVPNVPLVYDRSTPGEFPPYFVCDYIAGHMLPIDNAATDVAGTLDIFAQLCDIVEAVHRENVVHRDIKPENIIIDEVGGVHLVDFDIASLIDPSFSPVGYVAESTLDVIGTPAYLSPEVAKGQSPRFQSDIYAIGASLFRILTGRPVFEADSPVAMAYHHVGQPPPAPSSLNQAIAPELDALILRCLAKDPDERPQTATELGDELRLIRDEVYALNA